MKMIISDSPGEAEQCCEASHHKLSTNNRNEVLQKEFEFDEKGNFLFRQKWINAP